MNTRMSAQYVWTRCTIESKLPVGIDTLTRRVESEFKATSIGSSWSASDVHLKATVLADEQCLER